MSQGVGHYVTLHPTKTKSKGGPIVPPQGVHPGHKSYQRAHKEITRYFLLFHVHA